MRYGQTQIMIKHIHHCCHSTFIRSQDGHSNKSYEKVNSCLSTSWRHIGRLKLLLHLFLTLTLDGGKLSMSRLSLLQLREKHGFPLNRGLWASEAVWTFWGRWKSLIQPKFEHQNVILRRNPEIQANNINMNKFDISLTVHHELTIY